MTDRDARPSAPVEIEPVQRPIDGVVTLPGSKSYSNRALLVAALARGRSEITDALYSDDTRYMARALSRLGVRVRGDEASRAFVVDGVDGRFPAAEATLEIGNAGTAARFLTAAVALGHGTYVVDGSPAMRKRPIAPLLDGLRALGVDAESRDGTGCPPVVVRAKGIAGGRARMRGDISSQYFSALLMAAPYAEHDVEIEVEGALVSAPYVTMTLSTMEAFGVRVERNGDRWFRVPAGQCYQGRRYAVEPDASGASYFFAAAADGLRGHPGRRRRHRAGPGAPAGGRGRLHPHGRRGDDLDGHRAVRGRAGDRARHRPDPLRGE